MSGPGVTVGSSEFGSSDAINLAARGGLSMEQILNALQAGNESTVAAALAAKADTTALTTEATARAAGDALAVQKSANLSDLGSPPTARTSLGLGSAATRNVGTASGTVAAGDDSRLTSLGNSATRNVGTSAGTVAAGDDSRITTLGNAATKNVGTAAGTVAAGNDSRITSLGNAATRNVGSGSGTVAAGDDSRLTFSWMPDGLVKSGNLTASSTAALIPGGLRVPVKATIAAIEARLGTAPAGSSASVVMRVNGSAVAAAAVTLPAGSTREYANLATPVVVYPGDIVQFFTPSAGSSTPGADLAVMLSPVALAFQPNMIPGLALWYAPETMVEDGALGGTAAPNWRDRAGTGYTLLTFGGNTYRADVNINGHSAGVEGGVFGIDWHSDPLSGLPALTLVASFKLSGSQDSLLIGRGSSNGFVSLMAKPGGALAGIITTGGTPSETTITSAGGKISTGSHTAALIYDGSNMSVRLDGTQETTSAKTGAISAVPPSDPSSGFAMGTSNMWGGYTPSNFTMFEALLFSRALSTAELGKIETYLAARR